MLLSALCLGLLLFLLPPPSYSWKGTVVTVQDGDTLIVSCKSDHTRIRLYGVDAPEHGQAFGRKARNYLTDLVRRKTVDVEPLDTDSYERSVALVRLEDGTLVNQALINAGFAWVYTRYCTQPQCLEWKRLEGDARAGRRGLWKDKRPVPPWIWRKTHPEE